MTLFIMSIIILTISVFVGIGHLRWLRISCMWIMEKIKTKATKTFINPPVLNPYIPPPAHLTYEVTMAILDKIIQDEWATNRKSLILNQIDRAVVPGDELKRMTLETLKHLSPTLRRDINYFITHEYLILYISRKLNNELEAYIEGRLNGDKNQFTV